MSNKYIQLIVFLSIAITNTYAQTNIDPQKIISSNQFVVNPIYGSNLSLSTNVSSILWNPALLTNLDGIINFAINTDLKRADELGILALGVKTKYLAIGFAYQQFNDEINSINKLNLLQYSIAAKINNYSSVGLSLKNIKILNSENDQTYDLNNYLFDTGLLFNYPSTTFLFDYLSFGANIQNIGDSKYKYYNRTLSYKKNLRIHLSMVKYLYRDLFSYSFTLYDDIFEFKNNKLGLNISFGFFNLIDIGYSKYKKDEKYALSLNIIDSKYFRLKSDITRIKIGVNLSFGFSNLITQRFKNYFQKNINYLKENSDSIKKISRDKQNGKIKNVEINNEDLRVIKSDNFLEYIETYSYDISRETGFFYFLSNTRQFYKNHFIGEYYKNDMDSISISIILNELKSKSYERQKIEEISNQIYERIASKLYIRCRNKEKEYKYFECLHECDIVDMFIRDVKFKTSISDSIIFLKKNIEQKITKQFFMDIDSINKDIDKNEVHKALNKAYVLRPLDESMNHIKKNKISKLENKILNSNKIYETNILLSNALMFYEKGQIDNSYRTLFKADSVSKNIDSLDVTLIKAIDDSIFIKKKFILLKTIECKHKKFDEYLIQFNFMQALNEISSIKPLYRELKNEDKEIIDKLVEISARLCEFENEIVKPKNEANEAENLYLYLNDQPIEFLPLSVKKKIEEMYNFYINKKN